MNFTEQLDLPLNETYLSDILPGNCCQVANTKKMLMKVKPTGFLLNSNVVAVVLGRGDCFVVDLVKGTLYATSKDVQVIPIEISANYKKIVQ